MSALALKPRRVLRAPGLLAILGAILVGFALGARDFTTLANLVNIALQSSVLLLLALPMTLVVMTEGLDLSIGAALSLASVVLAQVAVATGSVWLAAAAGLGVGAALGAVNGVLIAVIRIPPFVATLGMLGIAQGLALVASDGQSITGIPASVDFFYGGHVFGAPAPILLMIVAYLLTHGLLYRTRFGTYVVALGGNREALALAGVNWRAMLILVYVLTGAFAGFAALLLTARLNAGHPTAGIGMEFDAIAAVALGGTSFEKGDGWLPGTLLGVLTIGVLHNGLNLLAIPSALQVCCIGLLVILAFFLEALRKDRP